MVGHTLFSSEASLVPNHRGSIVKMRLLYQSCNCLDWALKPVLRELDKIRTVYPGTNLRLVYEFVSGSRQRQCARHERADRVRLSSRPPRPPRRTDPAGRCRPHAGDC